MNDSEAPQWRLKQDEFFFSAFEKFPKRCETIDQSDEPVCRSRGLKCGIRLQADVAAPLYCVWTKRKKKGGGWISVKWTDAASLKHYGGEFTHTEAVSMECMECIIISCVLKKKKEGRESSGTSRLRVLASTALGHKGDDRLTEIQKRNNCLKIKSLCTMAINSISHHAHQFSTVTTDGLLYFHIRKQQDFFPFFFSLLLYFVLVLFFFGFFFGRIGVEKSPPNNPIIPKRPR